jgi:hypothetical protein
MPKKPEWRQGMQAVNDEAAGLLTVDNVGVELEVLQ